MRVSRRRIRAWVLLVVLLVAAIAGYLATAPPPSPSPNPSGCRGTAACVTGTVAKIVDGDTLDVGSTRIRLALVNTPEVSQPGYQEAKDFTAATCPVGSQALVDQDDGQLNGSYGRMVAEVHCGGVNLNAALLESGHAAILTQFCSVSEFADEAWAAACH